MEQEEDVETMQEVGVEEDVSEKREELIFEEEEEEVGVEEDVNEKCEELIMEEEEVEVEVEVEDESEEVIEKREAMKVEEDGMKEEVKDDDKNENDITEEDWQGLFRRIEDLAAECILDKSDHLNFCLMLISLSSFSKKSPTGPTERTPKSEYLNKSN